jgi:hypothetical protein
MRGRGGGGGGGRGGDARGGRKGEEGRQKQYIKLLVSAGHCAKFFHLVLPGAL